jgi:GNAT superfamily N-acetyltransferase
MTLEISPVAEAEVNQWTLLAISAFQTGIGHLLTGPNTPDNIEKKNANSLKSLREDPSSRFLKVIDTSTGEMVAGASWYIYVKGNTEAELDKMFARPTPENSYPEDWEPIYTYLKGNRRQIMGTRPYAFLNMLFTSPTHFRRGAGAMLLKWGVEKANELGLECYLESSVEGRALYERFGFKVLKEARFDMADFGRADLGTDVNCIMYREAQKQ